MRRRKGGGGKEERFFFLGASGEVSRGPQGPLGTSEGAGLKSYRAYVIDRDYLGTRRRGEVETWRKITI